MDDHPPPGNPDADRLTAVAQAAKALGMRISALVVGDVKVVLAEPWGAASEVAVAPPQETPANEEERKLAELRRRSKALFGRVLTDDALLKFEGLL